MDPNAPGLLAYPRLHDASGDVYVLFGSQVHHFAGADGAERARWHFDDEALPPAVRAWVAAFWAALRAAPTLETGHHAWWTRSLTHHGGHVYAWTDDRHEFTNVLDGAWLAEAYTPRNEEERAWLAARR